MGFKILPTITEEIQKACKLLRAISTTPYLDSELLMMHALNISKRDIIVNGSKLLNTKELESYIDLIKRREKNEPIAYICGTQSFWNSDFRIRTPTLIPRPDTEAGIELVLEIFNNKSKFFKIADLGSGSGCIIITLLKEYKNATGVAFERNPLVASNTNMNRMDHNLYNRMIVERCSWEMCKGKYDLIISNPPYISYNDMQNLLPNVVHYESREALFGGCSGIICYLSLLKLASRSLSKYGVLILELGYDSLPKIRGICSFYGLYICKIKKDLSGITRYVALKRKNKLIT